MPVNLICEKRFDDFRLRLDGPVGDPDCEDSIWLRDVVRAIESTPLTRITVDVNSWGGSIAEGLSIYAYLSGLDLEVVTRVRCMAASAASIIVMAGALIEIQSDAQMMLHSTYCFSLGIPQTMRDQARRVDTMDHRIAEIYASVSRRDTSVELAALRDGGDRWLSADDALRFGYAHRVVDPVRRSMLNARDNSTGCQAARAHLNLLPCSAQSR